MLHLSAEQRGESKTPYCAGKARLAVEIVFAIQRILKYVAANFPNWSSTVIPKYEVISRRALIWEGHFRKH